MSTDNTMTEDLTSNLRAAERLVNVLGAQRDETDRAYARGWEECGKVVAELYAQAWEAGYWAREADRHAEWEEFQAWLRSRGEVRTFEERRAVELAACGPRPGDFRGIEQDPEYIDRCRASLESITTKDQRAA